jgi:O-methyltransferase
MMKAKTKVPTVGAVGACHRRGIAPQRELSTHEIVGIAGKCRIVSKKINQKGIPMLTRSLDNVRDSLATSQSWSSFKKNHPAMFKSLAYGYRAYRSYKILQYRRIYKTFKPFTMLLKPNYINNLSLCDQYRTVKGSVVEAGTWKGGMIAGIAKLLGPGRAYYLYDSFQGLPPATERDALPDGYSAISWQADLKKPEWQGKTGHGNLAVSQDYAEQAMKLSGATKYKITPGWFRDTLPTYDSGPIAILRMDGDFYESIMDTLNELYEQVVPGGVIIIDDYYYWQGASMAVHDFLSQNKLIDRIHQHRDLYPFILKH